MPSAIGEWMQPSEVFEDELIEFLCSLGAKGRSTFTGLAPG